MGLATHSQHQIEVGVNIKKNQIFEEELIAGVGWGRGQIKVGVGSLTTNLEILEEELNTGVGWGRGQTKVGVGVGNSFPTPD